MTPIAVILYEDKRGPQKQFGLHDLVLACVADDLGGDLFALGLREKLDGRPLKGVGNLIRSCRNDVRRLGPQGQTVFAVIDDDEIRSHLKHEGVPARANDEVVMDAIKTKCGAREQLEVILLKENTESIVEAVQRCDNRLPADLAQKALQKDLNARDVVLGRHAAWAHRSIRDCVRARVPALERLVKALQNLVAAHDVMES